MTSSAPLTRKRSFPVAVDAPADGCHQKRCPPDTGIVGEPDAPRAEAARAIHLVRKAAQSNDVLADLTRCLEQRVLTPRVGATFALDEVACLRAGGPDELPCRAGRGVSFGRGE